MNYFVKPVVCDYGVYWVGDNGERKLIVICNSLSNAEMVAEILNSDEKHEVWSRPQGEWIDRNGNTTYPFWLRYECSICHGHSGMADYCYHCGAKMKGEEE